VAYRILQNRADAEDLVQDAFLVALERIDDFDAERPFGPWFFAILWNRGLNARQSRATRRTAELPPTIADSGPLPDEETQRREERARLEAAMAELTERQRDVIRLHELEGLTSATIAEMLGISAGTVRWHLHRAREALRRAVGTPPGRAGAGEGS